MLVKYTVSEFLSARGSFSSIDLSTLAFYDFINLTQVHNFTVNAQDILPSVNFCYLP